MPGIEKLRNESKKYYKKIKSVYSPALMDYVYFASKGFNHLLYKPGRKNRNVAEQYLKLKSLKHVVDVIKRTRSISRIEKRKISIKGKSRTIYFYELSSKGASVFGYKVIVEKAGKNGRMHFLSVMPHGRRFKSKKRRKAF